MFVFEEFHVGLCLYIYLICLFLHRSFSAHKDMSVYIDNLSGYVYMCHYICLPAYAYMYTSLLATYLSSHARSFVHVCACIYIYTYIYIHTDIHTCMRIHGSCDVSPFNEFQALKHPHRNALAIQAWPDQLFH